MPRYVLAIPRCQMVCICMAYAELRYNADINTWLLKLKVVSIEEHILNLVLHCSKVAYSFDFCLIEGDLTAICAQIPEDMLFS